MNRFWWILLLGIVIGLFVAETALGQTILDLVYGVINTVTGAIRGAGEGAS